MINISNIKKYLKNPLNNHLLFDIAYTKKELKYIDNFIISNRSSFNFYGDKDNFSDDKLNTFLTNIGPNDDISILNNIINKLINKITKAYNTNYIWITIRITLPNHIFDIKRWHKDGPFFTNPERINQTKFVTVLKGPGTLFHTKSKLIDELYGKYRLKKFAEYDKLNIINTIDQTIEMKYRKIFISKFKHIKYKQLKNNQGLIFITGNNYNDVKDGLLHSEPKADEPRFFISILPGTKEEITKLKQLNEIK
jgi:hypothetical protein